MSKTVKRVLFSAVAATLGVIPMAMAQQEATVVAATPSGSLVERTTVTSACGKLFTIDANADGLTAEERATIIQKNLDNALVKALHRTPNAVTVELANNNPTVKLDGLHIATADGNSAARAGMTQMQLANKWADSIRFCLSDTAAIQRYLSSLTGNFPTKKVMVQSREEVAYIPAGKFLPIKLNSAINGATAQVGDKIEGVISTDIPLQTSYFATRYDAYIPEGSVAVGRYIDASNNYLGKGALGMQFDEIRTPSGESIPINAHVLGGPGSWVVMNVTPEKTACSSFARTLEDKGAAALPVRASICGGWRGYPIAQGPNMPYQKMTLTRKAPIAVSAGTPMILQMTAPTALSLVTDGASVM